MYFDSGNTGRGVRRPDPALRRRYSEGMQFREKRLRERWGSIDRLARKNWPLEWGDIIRDLDNLVEMEVAISGKGYVFRGQSLGVAGKVFQACGVALPPTLRSS